MVPILRRSEGFSGHLSEGQEEETLLQVNLPIRDLERRRAGYPRCPSTRDRRVRRHKDGYHPCRCTQDLSTLVSIPDIPRHPIRDHQDGYPPCHLIQDRLTTDLQVDQADQVDQVDQADQADQEDHHRTMATDIKFQPSNH